jgi:hypothetical protein
MKPTDAIRAVMIVQRYPYLSDKTPAT